MTKEEVLHLAKEFGIELKNNLSINEMGIDFIVVFAEDKESKKWVIRIPRRNDLGEQIKQEKKILELTKENLSVDVPDWQITYPNFIAYPLLKNKPVISLDHNTGDVLWNIDKKSTQYIISLAKTLVEIHNIPQEKAEIIGIKSLNSQAVRREVLDNIVTVKSELGISEQLENRWRKWVDTDSFWPKYSTFIHGDLYAGHILTDVNADITGIIDWSEGQINDPTIDFAGHLALFGEDSLKTLIAYYKKFGGRVWDTYFEQTVERFAATALTYAIFALKTNSEEHLKAAKYQLGIR